jgi:hypothetical protein
VTGAASGAIPVPFLVLSFTEYNHLLSIIFLNFYMLNYLRHQPRLCQSPGRKGGECRGG